MSIQIYKPNKNNTGFAFSFYIGQNNKNKAPILFINAIAQHSWDAKKRLGSFSGSKQDPLKNISIKSKNRKIDPKITRKIWISMIRAFIDYEYRNFKKR